MLGTICFIGELFKAGILPPSIMHGCITRLFDAHNDDSLESLCRLLTIIGKDLDHVEGKVSYNHLWKKSSVLEF